ncbi:hypothetical protein LOTGIDRAFT_97912, partial [Lottia gigantea]
GPDFIGYKVLRLSADYITTSLTYIINLCIAKNTFPDILKHAKIKPVFIKGERNFVNDYRPISI